MYNLTSIAPMLLIDCKNELLSRPVSVDAHTYATRDKTGSGDPIWKFDMR